MGSEQELSDLQRQCACLALFPTKHDLEEHIEYFTLRVQRIRDELAYCQLHTAISDEEARPKDSSRAGGKHCPYKNCNGGPFQKRQKLREHYRQHVQCDEVCVICAKRFDRVSQFFTHIKRYERGEAYNAQKVEYLLKRRAALTIQADKSLSDGEGRMGSLKRSYDAAGLHSDLEDRMGSTAVFHCNEDLSNQTALGVPVATMPFLPHLPPAGFDGEEFSNPATHPNQDDSFDAPIASWMNFPTAFVPDASHPDLGG